MSPEFIHDDGQGTPPESPQGPESYKAAVEKQVRLNEQDGQKGERQREKNRAELEATLPPVEAKCRKCGKMFLVTGPIGDVLCPECGPELTPPE
jgi:hypothetical protein